jgi:hypothetical protein
MQSSMHIHTPSLYYQESRTEKKNVSGVHLNVSSKLALKSGL